ncbi:MAG: hypothetical protein MRQ09_01580 [Candidatus Midichloria sp.]|nr:hypothetical protein [Candidatus Midichloria sp.]
MKLRAQIRIQIESKQLWQAPIFQIFIYIGHSNLIKICLNTGNDDLFKELLNYYKSRPLFKGYLSLDTLNEVLDYLSVDLLQSNQTFAKKVIKMNFDELTKLALTYLGPQPNPQEINIFADKSTNFTKEGFNRF